MIIDIIWRFFLFCVGLCVSYRMGISLCFVSIGYLVYTLIGISFGDVEIPILYWVIRMRFPVLYVGEPFVVYLVFVY